MGEKWLKRLKMSENPKNDTNFAKMGEKHPLKP
jgi:hypothetical protein